MEWQAWSLVWGSQAPRMPQDLPYNFVGSHVPQNITHVPSTHFDTSPRTSYFAYKRAFKKRLLKQHILVKMPDSRKNHQDDVSDATLETVWKSETICRVSGRPRKKKAINFPEIVQTGFPGGSQTEEQAAFWKWKMQPLLAIWGRLGGFLLAAVEASCVRCGPRSFSGDLWAGGHRRTDTSTCKDLDVNIGKIALYCRGARVCLPLPWCPLPLCRNEVTQLGFKSRLLQLPDVWPCAGYAFF